MQRSNSAKLALIEAMTHLHKGLILKLPGRTNLFWLWLRSFSRQVFQASAPRSVPESGENGLAAKGLNREPAARPWRPVRRWATGSWRRLGRSIPRASGSRDRAATSTPPVRGQTGAPRPLWRWQASPLLACLPARGSHAPSPWTGGPWQPGHQGPPRFPPPGEGDLV